MSNELNSSDAELTVSEQISQTASIIFKIPETGTDLFVTGSAIVAAAIVFSYLLRLFNTWR